MSVVGLTADETAGAVARETIAATCRVRCRKTKGEEEASMRFRPITAVVAVLVAVLALAALASADDGGRRSRRRSRERRRLRGRVIRMQAASRLCG
jgi:hypothetical protein